MGGRNWNGEFSFLGEDICKKDILDIVQSPEVTYCPSNPYSWDMIDDDTYDLVMSSDAFQHIDYFWETIREMKRVCKPGGLIYVIAPSMRYDGQCPYANYAFNTHGMVAIAQWADIEVIDASVAGIPFEKAGKEWDDPLDDAVLIARKKPGDKDDIPELQINKLKYERRYVYSVRSKIKGIVKENILGDKRYHSMYKRSRNNPVSRFLYDTVKKVFG